MATVGSLIFEMSANIARLQQDMSKATESVKTATDAMNSAIAVTKQALGALGIGLSVEGLVSFVHGGIQAEAALYKLSLQTGVTVETLSSLKGVAKQAATDMETVAGLVNKLEKNMLTFAQSGGGKAADAFKQLGYTQAQVQSGLKNMDTFLPEFAKRLVQAGVGGEQAGLAMQLMAKGGAQALPFLKQLAEAGPLVAKVFTEQAEAAHQFEVNMIKLKAGSGALAISLANDFLPALNAITDAMVQAKKEGGSLAAVWAGLKAITVGTEKFQAEKDLFNQTSKMLSAEAELARLRKNGYVEDSFAVITLKKKIDTYKDEIAQSRARIELLQREEDIRAKANKIGESKPLADLPKDRSFWTERDEYMYKQRVQAAKELGISEEELAAAEQRHADNVYANSVAAQKDLDLIKQRNEALAQQAQNWKDVIDPLEPYRRQMVEINRLHELARLTDEEWAKAINIVSQQMGELNKVADKTNQEAHSFGLTMESALGKMITSGMKAKDVVKALGQDIAQLITKLAILKPIEDAASSAYKNYGGISGIWGAMTGQTPSYNTGGLPKGSVASGMDSSDQVLASYANGTDYVPQTGLYQLHQGEKVTTAADNASGGGQPVMINFNITAVDARSVNQLLAQPATQRMIRGIIENGYSANGTVSGMAAR